MSGSVPCFGTVPVEWSRRPVGEPSGATAEKWTLRALWMYAQVPKSKQRRPIRPTIPTTASSPVRVHRLASAVHGLYRAQQRRLVVTRNLWVIELAHSEMLWRGVGG